MMVAGYATPDAEGDLALAHAYGFYQTDDGWFRRTSRNGQVQVVVMPEDGSWFFMTADPSGRRRGADPRKTGLDDALTNARRWLIFYNIEHYR